MFHSASFFKGTRNTAPTLLSGLLSHLLPGGGQYSERRVACRANSIQVCRQRIDGEVKWLGKAALCYCIGNNGSAQPPHLVGRDRRYGRLLCIVLSN